MTTFRKSALTIGSIAAVAAVVSFTKWWPHHRANVQADACIQNLRQIGLAARMVALTNNDVFLRDFAGLRAWIRPEFLVCPSANGEKPATWSGFDFSRVTYEMVGAGMSPVTNYSNVFVRCPIHYFKGYCDGWAPPRYCKGQGENK